MEFDRLTVAFIDTIRTILGGWEMGRVVTIDILPMYEVEEDFDIYDDVDESMYDPYMGCDFYESYDYDLTEW